MTEIILIYPPIQRRIMSPALGVLYLAGELEQNGFDVHFIDQLSPEKTKQQLKLHIGKETLFVGVSSMSGPQITNALLATKASKEVDPLVPVLWGGVHASLLPRALQNLLKIVKINF